MLDKRVGEVLRPIFDAYIESGFSPREISHIIQAMAFELEHEAILAPEWSKMSWRTIPLWTQLSDGSVEGPVYADKNEQARKALDEYRSDGEMTNWWFVPPTMKGAGEAGPKVEEIDWTGFTTPATEPKGEQNAH